MKFICNSLYSIYISDILKAVNQTSYVIKRKARFNVIVIYYLNATGRSFSIHLITRYYI